MKKAIVTGATGFIGKFLIRELVKQNVKVIAVVRKQTENTRLNFNQSIRIIECDLKDIASLPELVSDKGIDVVFHTAWQGVSDADARNQDIQIQNLKATLDLIEAAHKMSIRTFVGCGSIHEEEAMIEMSEDKVVTNLGLMYKTCKTAAHWMGKAKAGDYGMNFFWPLITNAYGEEEKSARLINTIIRQILHGESPALSSGMQYYDFVHVSDAARALYLIADKGVDGTNYIIGSGSPKPLRQFLEVIGEIANRERDDGKIVPLGFGKIINNVISIPYESFDMKRLQQDTGFVPTISFEEGIKRTVSSIYREDTLC